MDEPTKSPSPQPSSNRTRPQPVVNDITPAPAASVESDPIKVRVESSPAGSQDENTPSSDTPEFIETEKSSEEAPTESNEPSVEQPNLNHQESEQLPESEFNSTESDSPGDVLAKPPEESAGESSDASSQPPIDSDPDKDEAAPPADTNSHLKPESTQVASSNKVPTPENRIDSEPTMEMGVSASQSRKGSPNRNNRTFAIVSVIIISLLLSGAAIFVYLTTDNNAQPADTLSAVDSSRSSAASPAPSGVDAADVDNLLSEIVSGLQSTDTFDRDALSDDSIGL